MKEVVDRSEVRREDPESHRCRCYHNQHHGDAALVDDVEPVTLQKSTYYTRVSNEYTHKRIVKGGQRASRKGFRMVRDECLRQGRLFQDPEFPANDFSINFNGVTRRTYVWKRPHEIVKDPRFFIDGATRFDIQQGELGDCWLLAAVSNLTLNPDLFHVVVPRDQGFVQLYAGVFHFKFWQYGRWQEVVVDDLLPTYHGQLVFMHSKTPNEFWCALLEKAYAKLYGGYEALRGGNINESMVDLTGGVVEMVDLRHPPNNLFTTILKAYRRGALIGCAIEPEQHGVATESVMPNGLIMRHAYSITRATTVDISSIRLQEQQHRFSPMTKPHVQGLLASVARLGGSLAGHDARPDGMTNIPHTLTSLTNWHLSMAFPEGKAELIRLHNPWGNETEWKGSWSDKSPEWTTISPDDRQRLGLTFEDDGEFWMSFQDFVKNFTTLEICDVTPEVMDKDNSDSDSEEEDVQQRRRGVQQRWCRLMYEGAWVNKHSAGGCRNFLETFASNPQYTVTLEDPDEDDDDDLCTIVVSLMQKNVRQRMRYGADYVPIGFTIYKVPEGGEPGRRLDTEHFKYTTSFAKVPFFLNTREVTARFRFPAGGYVIIPSTFEPDTPGEFLLRIFTEAKRH